VLLSGCAHDGCHVGATARDQNHDVFHNWLNYDHPTPALTPIEARVLATLMEKARTRARQLPPDPEQPAAGLQPENQPASR